MIKLPRKLFCIDWDKRSLRMVVARANAGQIELDDAHSHRIPNNIDSEDPASMGEFIADMLRRHHWHQKRVILDVPRDKCVINRLTVPPTPEGELPNAVRFQAMKELPFPLSEAQIDFVIMQRDENDLPIEVLLAAVRTEVLDNLNATCEKAGLTPVRIGLRPYANLMSVRHLPEAAEQCVLFVDVGPTTAEIDVINNGKLVFSRAANVTIPMRNVESIGEDSQISSKAELNEIELGEEAHEAAVGELLIEVTRTLQAYRATEPGAVLDRVIVAGGTGVEGALIDALHKRLNTPCAVFDPADVLGVSDQEGIKLRSFPAVLGLAWGLSKEGLLELDFLNPKKPIPPRASLKRKLRIGGIAAAVVLAAGLGTFVNKAVQLNRELTALNKQINDDDGLRDQAAAVRLIDIQTMEVDDWDFQSRQAVWLDHLLRLTQSVIDPGKKMLVRSTTFDAEKGRMSISLWCGRRDADEFVRAIKDYRIKDKAPYQAVAGRWKAGAAANEKFAGKVDVTIHLLELQQMKANEKKTEKDRKNMMKKV